MTQQSHYWYIPCGVCVCVRERERVRVCVCSVTQPCLTLWDRMDCSPPGSSVHGISQARILELAAISYSRGSSQTRDRTCIFCISCISRQILYHCTIPWENHNSKILVHPNVQFSSVQTLSPVPLFVTPWAAAHQASLVITNTRSCSNSCAFSWWCHPTTSSSVIPLSCLQSFPASFPMNQFFTSGRQSIGASTSVLPVNIQHWIPLGWTGWISLQSKGLPGVFSNTTVQKHQFFGAQLSL